MKLEDIFQAPIAFHRCLVELSGSITAGLMLGQAWFWTRITEDPDGWFYKTADEWEEELAISRREQECAREKLRDRGFWKEERRGIPRKLYFRIDKKEFGEYLESHPLKVQIRRKVKTGRDKKGRIIQISPKVESSMAVSSHQASTKGDIYNKGTENTQRSPERAAFTPPSKEQVQGYMIEVGSKGPLESSQRFMDHYEAVGWMMGRNQMRNWQAAVRKWVSGEKDFPVNRNNGHSAEPEEPQIPNSERIKRNQEAAEIWRAKEEKRLGLTQ